MLEALHQMFMDGYEVTLASSGPEALELLRHDREIDAVILDIKMPKVDGLRTSEMIREHDPALPVILFTGYPGEYSEKEIDARHQPFDYVRKADSPERLRRTVRNAVSQHRLLQRRDELVTLARDEYEMVGKSEAIRKVYMLIERLAPTDNRILIFGPTGSGKELVARAIHRRSNRAHKQLVTFNCSLCTASMIDRELFGHIKGAFTDALEDKPGIFSEADGGTLFLDEISNLDRDIQSKLLRVLDDGEYLPVGSPKPRRADFRLICATNRDLEDMVAKGLFRDDLYYRLRGAVVEVPPLNRRLEDIPDLILHFCREYCHERKMVLKHFADDAMDLLIARPWPGNVRDLRYEVRTLIDLTPSSLISRDDVLELLSIGEGEAESITGRGLKEMRNDFERMKIIQALTRTDWNIAAAARLLHEDPANLRRTMKRLGIDSGRSDSRAG
jgi:DNA-binding NtrC family response regulator